MFLIGFISLQAFAHRLPVTMANCYITPLPSELDDVSVGDTVARAELSVLGEPELPFSLGGD